MKGQIQVIILLFVISYQIIKGHVLFFEKIKIS